MLDCDSEYYCGGVKYHLITSHCKNHTKRLEANIVNSAYGVPIGCAYRRCMVAAIKWSSDSNINREETCHKCGWKILYTEAYKNTEQGWGKRDYYYHLECYKK